MIPDIGVDLVRLAAAAVEHGGIVIATAVGLMCAVMLVRKGVVWLRSAMSGGNVEREWAKYQAENGLSYGANEQQEADDFHSWLDWRENHR